MKGNTTLLRINQNLKLDYKVSLSAPKMFMYSFDSSFVKGG